MVEKEVYKSIGAPRARGAHRAVALVKRAARAVLAVCRVCKVCRAVVGTAVEAQLRWMDWVDEKLVSKLPQPSAGWGWAFREGNRWIVYSADRWRITPVYSARPGPAEALFWRDRDDRWYVEIEGEEVPAEEVTLR